MSTAPRDEDNACMQEQATTTAITSGSGSGSGSDGTAQQAAKDACEQRQEAAPGRESGFGSTRGSTSSANHQHVSRPGSAVQEAIDEVDEDNDRSPSPSPSPSPQHQQQQQRPSPIRDAGPARDDAEDADDADDADDSDDSDLPALLTEADIALGAGSSQRGSSRAPGPNHVAQVQPTDADGLVTWNTDQAAGLVPPAPGVRAPQNSPQLQRRQVAVHAGNDSDDDDDDDDDDNHGDHGGDDDDDTTRMDATGIVPGDGSVTMTLPTPGIRAPHSSPRLQRRAGNLPDGTAAGPGNDPDTILVPAHAANAALRHLLQGTQDADIDADDDEGIAMSQGPQAPQRPAQDDDGLEDVHPRVLQQRLQAQRLQQQEERRHTARGQRLQHLRGAFMDWQQQQQQEEEEEERAEEAEDAAVDDDAEDAAVDDDGDDGEMQ